MKLEHFFYRDTIKELIYIHNKKGYEDFPLNFRVDIEQYFAQLCMRQIEIRQSFLAEYAYVIA